MARPMPVFPEEGSIRVWPGFSVPSFSASSTMDRAMRSLMEPPGFCPSSLARMRTSGLGLRAVTSTSGVFPIRSRTLAKEATTLLRPCRPGASRHGGEDGDHIGVGDLGVESFQVTDVVVVAVDVHEPVEGPFGSHHLPRHAGVGLDEVLEH